VAALKLEVRTFVADPFGENAYLVWRDGATGAVAVDPGGEAEAMADSLAAEGLWLEAILLTHAHLDHIEGVAKLVGRTGARVHMHPADRPLYDHAAVQAAQFGMRIDDLPPVDAPLAHGDLLRFGDLEFEVRHVPGHSPGHVILYLAEDGVAFVGDVVFQASIGRTDLPGGDYGQLMRGIREHVLTLPAETLLYPGHGPETTVGHERATNPFLVPTYGGGLA
jgi:hydroxyacylglutathione hydrolase